jgi:uncharacterized protein
MSDEQSQPSPPVIQPPPNTPPQPRSPESEARTWNMFCHLSALAGFVGVPLGNVLGPLVVWQIKKGEIPSVEVHGKAALNFQLTLLIAGMVVGAATVIGMFFCGVGLLLVPVLILIGLAGIIFPIIAGIKANNGEDYKYPWSWELVK